EWQTRHRGSADSDYVQPVRVLEDVPVVVLDRVEGDDARPPPVRLGWSAQRGLSLLGRSKTTRTRTTWTRPQGCEEGGASSSLEFQIEFMSFRLAQPFHSFVRVGLSNHIKVDKLESHSQPLMCKSDKLESIAFSPFCTSVQSVRHRCPLRAVHGSPRAAPAAGHPAHAREGTPCSQPEPSSPPAQQPRQPQLCNFGGVGVAPIEIDPTSRPARRRGPAKASWAGCAFSGSRGTLPSHLRGMASVNTPHPEAPGDLSVTQRADPPHPHATSPPSPLSHPEPPRPEDRSVSQRRRPTL
ncbi:hypothetical protein THAOC_20917, partial [Thalassiosira oceanica]